MQAIKHAHRNARSVPHSGQVARTGVRRSPQMHNVQPRAQPEGWYRPHRATYFYDAAWHSAQTLRHLVRAVHADHALGMSPPPELLSLTLQTMLDSLCPGLEDDAASLACFRQLLQMHLSGLGAEELRRLSATLKQQRFDCVVTDMVVDDAMLEEHGFTNGPPHCRQRTLMFTPGLHDALDTAADAANEIDGRCDSSRRLTAIQAQDARDALAAFAAERLRSAVTLTGMASTANRLAQAIGLTAMTEVAVAATPLSPASSVAWESGQLIVEVRMLAALMASAEEGLHAEWARDLLELLLMQRLFGTSVTLASLTQEQRSLLLRSVEQVMSCVPRVADTALPALAAGVLDRAHSFGTIQVFPGAGTLLGHAWITPSLSVMPDKSRTAVPIGKRYMRPGGLLKPVQCMVKEWEIRWLTAQENEERYPAAQAWHLSVPAHWLKLQQAAEHTREEWQRKALPYRFIGIEPGMPPTGCRVKVWHAVQKAMDADTRRLFEHFRQGLPDPESPTELALRTGQFMDWLTALAKQAERRGADL